MAENQDGAPITPETLSRIKVLVAQAYQISGQSDELEDEVGGLLRRLESGYYTTPEAPPTEFELLSEAFKITSVSRQDLIDAGFTKDNALSLSYMEMDQLASKMADDYCNQLFWDHLHTYAESILETHHAEH